MSLLTDAAQNLMLQKLAKHMQENGLTFYAIKNENGQLSYPSSDTHVLLSKADAEFFEELKTDYLNQLKNS